MFDSSTGGWSNQALEAASFGVLVLHDKQVVWLNHYLAKILKKKSADLEGCMLSADDKISVLLL
ncbi:MAG: GGDEF domain-containing protein, partial [Piscirickettsiaceae bacterium]